MRPYSTDFKIGGKPMLVPDAPLQVSYEDVLSSDSGRDESGVMHNISLRRKVEKWTFVYSSLTEEEKNYMESIFPDTAAFDFTKPDRMDTATATTSKASRTSYGIAYYDASQKLWKNYKFIIQEC